MDWRKILGILLLSPTLAWAGAGFDCRDSASHIIFCPDFGEGYGPIAYDRAQYHMDLTLSNGPAWVNKGGGRKETNVANATMSMVSPNSSYVTFTPDASSAQSSASSNKFDFSGNKPFMMFFMVAVNNANPPGVNAPLIAHCSVGVGWDIIAYGSPNLDWNFNVVGNVEVHWQIGYKLDSEFHTYGVWRDPITPTNYRLYYDGKFVREQAGASDFNSEGTQSISIAAAACNNNGEFSGRVGPMRIWDVAVDRQQVDSFFLAAHRRYFGAKSNLTGARR